MKGRDDKNEPDSLVKKWGVDKQDRWNEMRNEAIKNAAAKLQDAGVKFNDFYDHLVSQRVNIANELSPDISTQINLKRAQTNLNHMTTVGSEGTYKDYLGTLSGFFNDLPGNHDKIAMPMSLKVFGLKDVSEDGTKMQLNQFETFQINYGNVPYTTLTKLYITKGDEKLEWVNIGHTNSKQIGKALENAKVHFDALQNNKELTKLEKIEHIKKLSWHVFHAMPQIRGSAAIGEMMIESLLNRHGIEYIPEKGKPTLDLIAIFSETPEKFCERVKLNKNLEKGYKLDSTAHLAKQLNPASPESIVSPGKSGKEAVQKTPVQSQESSGKHADKNPVLNTNDDVINTSGPRKRF